MTGGWEEKGGKKTRSRSSGGRGYMARLWLLNERLLTLPEAIRATPLLGSGLWGLCRSHRLALLGSRRCHPKCQAQLGWAQRSANCSLCGFYGFWNSVPFNTKAGKKGASLGRSAPGRGSFGQGLCPAVPPDPSVLDVRECTPRRSKPHTRSLCARCSQCSPM